MEVSGQASTIGALKEEWELVWGKRECLNKTGVLKVTFASGWSLGVEGGETTTKGGKGFQYPGHRVWTLGCSKKILIVLNMVYTI